MTKFAHHHFNKIFALSQITFNNLTRLVLSTGCRLARRNLFARCIRFAESEDQRKRAAKKFFCVHFNQSKVGKITVLAPSYEIGFNEIPLCEPLCWLFAVNLTLDVIILSVRGRTLSPRKKEHCAVYEYGI